MSGAQFDRAYMNLMLADHKKDVAEFKTEAAKGNDPGVKNFAKETLPTLESHLHEAEQVQPKAAAENHPNTTARVTNPQ